MPSIMLFHCGDGTALSGIASELPGNNSLNFSDIL